MIIAAIELSLIAAHARMPARNLLRNINGVAIMAGIAAERGLPLRGFLAGSGLTKETLDDPRTTVTFKQEFRLIRNLQHHCGDPPGLGLAVGSRYRFTSLASVGFILVSSPTLRCAFDVFMRYVDLNASMVRPARDDDDREGDDLRFGFVERELPADIRRFAIERSSAVALALSRELLGRPVVPRAVEFTFARPRAVSVYRRFTRVTPTFGAAKNGVILKREDADASLAKANPLALRMAEDYCRRLLATWKARTGVAAQVRDYIARRPDNVPGVDEVASSLFMSARTLRRRLAREGTTYLELCDEVREAVAEQLLEVPGLSIDRVAERLGYSEAASFINAFKRWKGQTPQTFRRSLI